MDSTCCIYYFICGINGFHGSFDNYVWSNCIYPYLQKSQEIAEFVSKNTFIVEIF